MSKKIVISLYVTLVLITSLVTAFIVSLYPLNTRLFTICIIVIGIISLGISYFLLNKFIHHKIQKINHILGIDLNNEALDEIVSLEEKVTHYNKKKRNEYRQLLINDKYRKEFVGNVSHELKTPLFNIQGYAELLLEEKVKKKTRKKYLKKISKNVDRLIDIVGDLNTITKIDAGKQKLNYTKFNLKDLYLEVIDDISELTEKRNSKIITELNDNYMVYADRGKIYQVLYNLIENALKYCPKNSQIIISNQANDEIILTTVRDNGPGIDKEKLPRIFERFYRLDEHRNRSKGGSGLGLSIIKNILEAHGKSIKVNSKVGEGTSFIFSLDRI